MKIFFTLLLLVLKSAVEVVSLLMIRMLDPNKVKNMNLKVFNLMSEVNETIFLVQHESCVCKCME